MRLNKYLSQALGLSRRAADDLIVSGKITLNGKQAALGDRVEEKDEVRNKGHKIKFETFTPSYVILNKPVGYLSSKVSQGGVPTVYELLPKELQKLNLNIAGRLDKDTSGLMLLTNDGSYLNQLAHPGHNKQKIYIVELDKELTDEDAKKLMDGIQIGDSRPSKFEDIKTTNEKELEVALSEGRNRQIRRTFKVLGYEVTKLHRTKIGDHELADLKEGEYSVLDLA